jgi:competence protein ComEC
MMQRPLVWLSLFFCAGIFVAKAIHPPFFSFYAAALASFSFALLANKRPLLSGALFCTFVFFLGGLLLRNRQTLPRDHLGRHVFTLRGRVCSVEGIVCSQPLSKIKRINFVLEADKIIIGSLSAPCRGLLWVRINARKKLRYGDYLRVSGYLSRPFRDCKTGSRSWQDYLATNGIYTIMHIRSSERVRVLGRKTRFSLPGLTLSLKNKAENVFFRYLPPVPASILNAMLLGDRAGIPSLVNLAMMKTGTVHILVVSGFNAALVIFILELFLKMLRLGRRVRMVVIPPLLILYCLLAGASPPVVRATVIAVIFFSSYALKREPDAYNSCAVALLFILMINPLQLFDLGLQLSFSSVLALLYFYPKLKRLLRAENLKHRPLRFLLEGILVSFSAWIGTLGLVAYYFKLFSPVTVLANLIIVPLATLITFSGFTLLFSTLALPWLAPQIAASSEFLVTLLLRANSLLLHLPAACLKLP